MSRMKLPSKFTTCYSFACFHLKIFSSSIKEVAHGTSVSYIWSESFGVVPSVRKVQCFCGSLKTVVLIVLIARKQLDAFVGKQLAFLESIPNRK